MKDKTNYGSYVMYRDKDGNGHKILDGITEVCKAYCEDNNWEYEGNELEMWTVYY